ncbi:uncharacterized protein LTR77_011218 [Saxophila tyrrhenica]|uniref:Uncharacterized protein n=1 Tax=Saxophila tyrrhenica TaxID=1690608 RepID=A0AAV9NTD9_9PEZI|nr:hypothetical protein LTR77_011218 [Saxophila tyrrhenica]
MDQPNLPVARSVVCYATFVGLAVLATYYMRLSPPSNAAGGFFALITEPKPFVFPETDIVLRRTYTGLGPVDMFLSFLVAAFLPGAAGIDRAFQLQQIHFLFSFLPVITVWSVEAARKGSGWKMISFTSFWAIFYQTVGGAIIIPLWYLCFTLTTSTTVYGNDSHSIPPTTARGLLPALLVGYVVPTTLMYLPFLDIDTQQFMVALWQPSPFFVNILWISYTRLAGAADDSQVGQGSRGNGEKTVKTLYVSSAVISAVVHVGVIGICLTSNDPQQSLWDVFMLENRESWSMSQALLFIFQIDFWIIFAASIACACIVVWDLHSLGLTTLGMVQAFAVIAFVSVVLGPGAALSGVWYWREGMLGKKAKKKST